MSWNKPEKSEFHPFYDTYIAKVPDGTFLDIFRKESQETIELLNSLSEDQWNYAYAPKKWTLKEAVLHMMDTERIFSYRLLRIARGDATPLPGFEQNDYVPLSNANARTGKNLLAEFTAIRAATLALLDSLTPEMLMQKGQASGVEVSARALAYMTLGHELHHREIIKERYLE